MDVIQRLKDIMEERKWSEYRLAKEAKLAQSTITNIFYRNTIPSIPTLSCICDAFGISLCQFFDETETAEAVSQMEMQNDWRLLTKEQQVLVRQIVKEFQSANK